MAVPIGISVGDFIATIKLFKDVGRALRQHGGAQSHFQKTVRDLEVFQAILSQLESFQSQSGNNTQINAIRGHAQLVSHAVDAFTKDIQKYQRALGRHAPIGVQHSPWAKIKWSRRVSLRAAELSKFVETQIRHIQILLDLDLSESTSTSLTRHAATAADVSLLPTRDELNTFGSAIGHDVRSSGERTIGRIVEVENAVLRRLGSVEAVMEAATKDFTPSTLAQELRVTLEDHFRQLQHSDEAPATARLTLTMTFPQLQISTHDMTLLFRRLLTEVEIVLQLIFARLCVLLKKLIVILPQMLVIMKVLQRLPQAISLVLHDNMTFEDALGRFHSLQYQQFRHWAVFETSLRCAFDNLPGMKRILRGQYFLHPANAEKTYSNRLDAENFAEKVKPGLSFKMSVEFKKVIMEKRRCPRGCPEGIEGISTYEMRCQTCGINLTSSAVIVVRSKESDDTLAKNRLGPEIAPNIQPRICGANKLCRLHSFPPADQLSNHAPVSSQDGNEAKGPGSPQRTALSIEDLPFESADGQGARRDTSALDSAHEPLNDDELQKVREEELRHTLAEMQYFKRVHAVGIEHLMRSDRAAVRAPDVRRVEYSIDRHYGITVEELGPRPNTDGNRWVWDHNTEIEMAMTPARTTNRKSRSWCYVCGDYFPRSIHFHYHELYQVRQLVELR